MQAAIEEDRSRRNKLRGQQNELSEILQSLYLKQNTARMNLEAVREKTENLRMDYQLSLIHICIRRCNNVHLSKE